MTDFDLEPLAQLLKRVADFEYGDVYLQGEYPWAQDSLGLIFLSDRYGEKTLEKEHPDFYHQLSLTRAMSVDRAEDVIRNAFMQKENVSVEEIVACFNFHYKHSGYLELT